MKHFILLLIAVAPLMANAQERTLIPQPLQLEWKEGQFVIDASTTIAYDKTNNDLATAAALLSEYIKRVSGINVAHSNSGKKTIQLKLGAFAALGKEGYQMEVSHSSIHITAQNRQGIVYALQTLIQLLPAVRTNEPLIVPALSIKDVPAFPWRGILLDVCRHYFSPELIKQFIDLLSAYKMNTLHWHLTDDQGWRVEIKKYPALTATGAWRVDHTNKIWGERPQAMPGEKPTYGGYYTQEQIRTLVQYAAQRGIRIVPEIELPGHCASAISTYPWLSCRQQAQLPMTGGNYTNIASSYCAGNDSVFAFLEDVLKEVMDLFPSEYIHIGGDELDKEPWKQCSKCQNRIKAEKLKNEEELQSYFIQRIEKIVNAKGKKMIGWDEILEGGLAPTATVMSWRGEAGGIAAAKMKHEVIMTPGNPLYIDHYQGDPALEPIAIGGFNSLKKVYEYDPVPKELSMDEGKYILGAQANLWTEYITTPMHATYMLLPRMLALAEITWSPAAKKDWNDFNRRLQAHFTRFDQQGIPYSKGNFKPSIRPLTEKGKMRASLSTEVYGGKIHFTTDGTMPGLQSQVYSMPVAIDSSMYLQAVTVLNGAVLPGSPAQQYFTMHKAVGKQVSYKFPQSSSYSADGAHSLTDGIKGTDNIGKYWHGFYDNDLIATIDLEQVQLVERITLGCLQRYRDWIFLPEKVDVEISTDGNQYTKITEIRNDVPATETTTRMKNFTASFSAVPARYIRITAKKIDGCPPGHPGAGKPGWIFADEIEVN